MNFKRFKTPEQLFPLRPPLPLPAGYSETKLFEMLSSAVLRGSPAEELSRYCAQDFRRFVYTWSLVRDLGGRCLELGANPYFTTLLLRNFTRLELTLANFFSPSHRGPMVQEVSYLDPSTGAITKASFPFHHFNIESDRWPFPDDSFDSLLFCEILEHMQCDPMVVLREIKRVLKPNGTLVLTTPNVSRLENVARMIAGVNIYDPYSGYGPYGRHNREFNKHELYLLLTHCGFDIDVIFSADVHENFAPQYSPMEAWMDLVKHREHDLGQYIFIRCSNAREAKTLRPSWLFRSFPQHEME